MAFCTLGPIWSRNVRLAAWGRSTPFPHAHRENRPIFQNKGFPSNPSWIMCRWTLQDRWAPPEHPRDTSHAFSARCLRLPIRPVPSRDAKTAQVHPHSVFVACPRATPLQLGPARTGSQKTQPARRRRCPLRSAWAGILRKACRWVAGCDGRAGAGLLGLEHMVPRAQPPHRRMPARREHKKRAENHKFRPTGFWAAK